MHFRQDHEAGQNIGCGHSRNWFVGVEVCLISLYRIGYTTSHLMWKAKAIQTDIDHWMPRWMLPWRLPSMMLNCKLSVVVPPGDECIVSNLQKNHQVRIPQRCEDWVWKNAMKKDDQVCLWSSFILLSLTDLNGKYIMQHAMWKLWLQQIAWLRVCKMSSYQEVVLPLSILTLWQTYTLLPHYTDNPRLSYPQLTSLASSILPQTPVTINNSIKIVSHNAYPGLSIAEKITFDFTVMKHKIDSLCFPNGRPVFFGILPIHPIFHCILIPMGYLFPISSSSWGTAAIALDVYHA